MLSLYNKLVYDYVNGEEIDNIEELENDYKFMIDVIKVSRDKNMYNLCSSDVKSNYEFVKFVIDYFKYDLDFVEDVANYYIEKKGNDDITSNELCFIMREIFKNCDDDRCLSYNMKCFGMYMDDKEQISKLIKCEYEDFGNDNLGLGFCYIINCHAKRSDIITRYYAKRFLNEIFYENDGMSIEEFIHSKINDVNKIKCNGVKAFIIDFVRNYDVFLSDYLFVHMDIISNVEKDINRTLYNWDIFNSNVLDRKNCIFEQEVNNLITMYNVNFDYIDVCHYIDNNLNLPIKFFVFDFNEYMGIDINKLNLVEYECLRKIIKLAKDLYCTPAIDKYYEYKMDEKTSTGIKCRTLTFEPKKNNNL